MKRPVLLLIAALMLGPHNVRLATAQDYPTRQITLIAPWPAGGAIDTLCRLLAPYFADRLGKPMVVMAGSGSLAISATIYKKLP
jgi:tripartite-type tricarboxylate transporter receptor subunit TctC